VPIRSRCKCDPVAREITNPSRFDSRMMFVDCRKGALSKSRDVGTMSSFVGEDAPPLGGKLLVVERVVVGCGG